MKHQYILIATMIFSLALGVKAQHSEHAKKENENPLQFAPVMTQILSDPELKEFKLESSVMTIIPGGTDTVSHRHDCELFGYVMDGAIEVALGKTNPQVFKAGQMFYEPRNILHTLTKNSSKEKPAKVLLIFIIKNGRNGYTPEYQ